MALAPTANDITVRAVLAKFETGFPTLANAVENGEFALWVGSGISRQAPNLGDLIERAFDFIRERAIIPETAANYLPALEEALGLAEVDHASVQEQYEQPLAAWPEHDEIIHKLWNSYSRVLDIRVAGEGHGHAHIGFGDNLPALLVKNTDALQSLVPASHPELQPAGRRGQRLDAPARRCLRYLHGQPRSGGF
jgi:hypothetical protein